MLERVRTTEVEPPLTETGTVIAQTLLVKVVVLGTLASTKTIRGTFVSVASSKAHQQGIIGTISVPLRTPGCDAVRCTSCRTTC